MLAPYTAFSWAPTMPYSTIAPMIWVLNYTTCPSTAAHQSLHLPEGRRAVIPAGLNDNLLKYPSDKLPSGVSGIWADNGIAAVAAKYDDFFRRFKMAGGQVDLIVLDYEDSYSNWNLTLEQLTAIQNDPRFEAIQERYSIDLDITLANDYRGHRTEVIKWNAIADQIKAEIINSAIFTPIRRYFPDVSMSNYQSYITLYSDITNLPYNGWYWYTKGLTGTHQSPAFYGDIDTVNMPITGPDVDWTDPFRVLLVGANLGRALTRASSLPNLPWIAYKGFGMNSSSESSQIIYPLADSQYYGELICHIMMGANTSNILYWNPYPANSGQWDNPENADDYDDHALHDAISALQRKTDNSTFRCITTDLVGFTGDSLITGIEFRRRGVLTRLYRITFGSGVTQATVTIPGDTSPTVFKRGNSPGLWYEESVGDGSTAPVWLT